jgi:hypothetical protein
MLPMNRVGALDRFCHQHQLTFPGYVYEFDAGKR